MPSPIDIKNLEKEIANSELRISDLEKILESATMEATNARSLPAFRYAAVNTSNLKRKELNQEREKLEQKKRMLSNLLREADFTQRTPLPGSTSADAALPINFPAFQSRITVPDSEGVDATALLRHHAIDRILEENRRAHNPFPGERVAPTSELETEYHARAGDFSRGVDATSQRMSALQTIQDRILSNAEQNGELSPEGRERFAYAAGVPNQRELLEEAKLDTEALMDLIKKRTYERYDYDKKNRSQDLDKKLTGRMALGKTWDSGDEKARKKFKEHEEFLLKEMRDNLDDTEKGIFRQSLHNVHGRDETTRQRLMSAVDRERQGNAQTFSQAQTSAQARRAQEESEYLNYINRLRLMRDAGGDQRQRAQEIIADQMRRFHEAQTHNTQQTHALASMVHGTPMPFIRPYVGPDAVQPPPPARDMGSDLLGLGLQGLGTVLDHMGNR